MRVYVANTDGASISIIDASTNRAIGEIPVSKNPHAVILSPDKTRFYVPSESEDVLDVIDRASLKAIARVPLAADRIISPLLRTAGTSMSVSGKNPGWKLSTPKACGS